MINYKDIQVKVQANSWDEQSKKSLIQLLPQCGEALLGHLMSKVGEVGGHIEAAKIVKIVALEQEWYQLIQQNQGYRIKDFILNNRKLLAYDMAGVMSIIVDMRNNKGVSSLIDEDLSDVFDFIEIDNLSSVSVSYLVVMLRARVVHMASITDLMMEVKRYCYMKSIVDPGSREMQAIKTALDDNKEVIGTNMLSIEEKKVNPEIRNWIASFLSIGAKSTDRSVFNVASFISHDKYVRAIKPNEQKIVTDVLKLYNWFYNPVVADEEIDRYNDSRPNLLEYLYTGKSIEPKLTPGLDLSDIAINRRGVSELQKESPKIINLEETEIRYNGDKRPVAASATMRRGLALGQQTNIVLDEEEKRLKQEMEEKKSTIEIMLRELRSRKQK